MYSTLLSLHSLVRWLVVLSLVFTVYAAIKGLIKKEAFTNFDNTTRHWTATIAHVQLMLGLALYFISPIVDYFLHHFKDAVHEREIRFFGMEHSLMMLIAVAVITVGSIKTKRKATDREKFKAMALWFGIALFIIITSVPWKFSPFTARPYFRPF